MTKVETKIKRNVELNNKNYPLFLKPSGKDYLWGGNRLNEVFNKKIDLSPLAETWECSTHEAGPSYVVSGTYNGRTLKEVLKENPEYLGKFQNSEGELPLLVKLIDAKKDLSVQVHPDDEFAKKYENGQQGKTEMWYVLDATENAKLIYGFKEDVDEDTIRKAIAEGKLENYLNIIEVHKDDTFLIEAGTVHAIGKGILIAEIQENSNLTYRLYDYHRRDKDGNLRELHIDKALKVMNYKSAKIIENPDYIDVEKTDIYSKLICECKYFKVYRNRINIEDEIHVKTKKDSFCVILCTDGFISIETDKEVNRINKGECVFIPANSVEIRLYGKADFLDIHC